MTFEGKGKEPLIWLLAIVMGALLLAAIFDAEAHHITINNNITEVTEVTEVYDNSMTIIEGVSDDDLASALSVGAASGGHQFDFSTTDWQGSVVGAWYDDQDAVSFGVAKRWDKLGKALMHGAYTQNGDEHLVVIGGTFRF